MKRRTEVIRTVFVVVTICGVLGSCNSQRTSAGLPIGNWGEHGFTQDQKRDLESLMNGAVENGDIPGGSLLLIHQGEVIFRKGFGYADLETQRSFTLKEVYSIASVSKPLTATLLVILEEKGLLSLDDPIEKWIPEFKGIKINKQVLPKTPPLLFQTLSHWSGLPGIADRGENFGRYYGTLSEVVKKLASNGLAAEPGTRYSYGQAGYKTAGRAAEIATGKSFEILFKEFLLEPLGMKHTTFKPSEEMLQNIPKGYLRTENGFETLPSEFVLRFIRWGIDPGGGIFSTLDDLGRFLLLHLNRGVVNGRRLVSQKALEQMYLVSDDPPQPSYGLGWHIINNNGLLIQHTGGSGTMVWIDFKRDMAGVFLTQARWSGNRDFQKRFIKMVQIIFDA